MASLPLEPPGKPRETQSGSNLLSPWGHGWGAKRPKERNGYVGQVLEREIDNLKEGKGTLGRGSSGQPGEWVLCVCVEMGRTDKLLSVWGNSERLVRGQG